MLHACIKRFDIAGNLKKIAKLLGTKQPPNSTYDHVSNLTPTYDHILTNMFNHGTESIPRCIRTYSMIVT
jgi:hypothetical protein